jgi:uncharacterized protein YcfJ
MVVGIVAGIAIAATGAVLAGYAMRSDEAKDATTQVADQSPMPTPRAAAPSGSSTVADAGTSTADAGNATADAASTADATSAPEENCVDESVELPAEPKDDNRIAGTVIGAVVGGALGHKIGGGTGGTVAGAAGGAYAGNRAQKEYQKRQTDTTVERHCTPAQ